MEGTKREPEPVRLRFTQARRDFLVRHRHELQCGLGYQNRRSLPCFGIRPTCPAGDLCKDCEYALHIMLWPLSDAECEGSDDTSFRTNCVGWMDRLIATKTCPFCQFIAKVVLDAAPGFSEDEMVCQTYRRRLIVYIEGLSYEAVTVTQPRQQQMNCSCSVYVQEVAGRDLDLESSPPYAAYVPFKDIGFRLDSKSLLSATDLFGSSSGEAAFLNLSRPVTETYNVRLFQDALETCRTRHGARCEDAVSALSRWDKSSRVPPTAVVPIRVVDVQLMNIVMLPLEANYVALSYCWSSRPYFTLNRANHEELRLPYSLEKKDLPPSVADAIGVVKSLGERYIWIDSLCILQDDVTDKQAQLGQMDDIYRAAMLTIVAAASSSDGIDMGLPGMRPASSRTGLGFVDIRGLRLWQRPPSLWEGLQTSRWHSRAWTFQEYLLSKRLLIFTPKQAYFVCEQATFAEDYIDHVCLNITPGSFDEANLTPCCDLTISENQSDGKASDMPSNYHNSYEELINSYTKRQMTHDSDAINAARGMLNLLRREYKVEFLCGLPLQHFFGRFMAWCPAGQSRRRAPTAAGITFPSWSWAGWYGEVIYPPNVWPDTVVDEGFTTGGIEADLESEIVDWSVILPSQMHHNERVSINPYALGADISKLDSCFLSFSAEVAWFRVAESTYGNPEDLPRPGERSLCRQIMVGDSQVGVVVPHYAHGRYSPHIDYQPAGSCKFLSLSRAGPRWKMWYPLVDVDPSDPRNFWYEDKGIVIDNPPFDQNALDLMEDIVNVLLLWRESNGIFYRGGIGQIHVAAWNAAKPQKKHILLG